QVKEAHEIAKAAVDADERAHENALSAEQKEIAALQQAAALEERKARAAQAAAAAEAATALATQQYDKFKQAGGSISGEIAAEQAAALKEKQQREVFDRERADLQDRISRGAYGQSKEELTLF